MESCNSQDSMLSIGAAAGSLSRAIGVVHAAERLDCVGFSDIDNILLLRSFANVARQSRR